MWSVLQISSALPFGPYQKRMHSHVVPILFRSALPYGPFCFSECTPMRSLTIFGLHSHMVLITFKNAVRSGPPLYSRKSNLGRLGKFENLNRVIDTSVFQTQEIVPSAF